MDGCLNLFGEEEKQPGAQSEAAGTITTARRVLRWGDEFMAMWKHLGGQPDGSIVQTEDSGNVTTRAGASSRAACLR